MSDYGDFCREGRDRKQAYRQTLPYCSGCNTAKATPQKNEAGEPIWDCHYCGHQEPRALEGPHSRRKHRR